MVMHEGQIITKTNNVKKSMKKSLLKVSKNSYE
jgi:hypothetical protein